MLAINEAHLEGSVEEMRTLRLYRRTTSRAGPKIFFVYRPDQFELGSTILRARQLAKIIQKHTQGRIEARLLPFDWPDLGPARQERWALSQQADAVYFFTKWAVRALKPSASWILRNRTRGVCFDHLDEPMTQIKRTGADFHIASSYLQLEVLENFKADDEGLSGFPRLVLHHADLGLEDAAPVQQDRFAALYLGDPKNFRVSPSILSEIKIITARYRHEFESSISSFCNYNIHVSQRPTPYGAEGAIKPFTKGAIAARLGVPIVIEREAPDAERLLGSDYPFFTDKNNKFQDVFVSAREGFKGQEWNESILRMRNMHEMLRPEVIAQQLVNIIDELYG